MSLISGLGRAERDAEGYLIATELEGRSGPSLGAAVQYCWRNWSVMSTWRLFIRYSYAGAPPITRAGEVWVHGLLWTTQGRYTLWTSERRLGVHFGTGPSLWLLPPT